MFTAPVQTGSATTRGVRDRGGSQSQRRRGNEGAVVGGNGPSPGGQSDISARVEGFTAGVVQQGGQSVFASSTAPSEVDRGKGKARSSGRVSERTAMGDLWSRATFAGAHPSLASADAIGGQGGGLNGSVVAGIAILALGLVGMTGAALVAAGRRRRA